MTALATKPTIVKVPARAGGGVSPLDVAAIEGILGALQTEYEHLARIALEHRRALSTADRLGVERCAAAQQAVAERLLPIEARRVAWAERVARPMGLAPGAALSAILAWTAEPARGRVLASAARLREVGEAVREQHRVIRAASEALLAHVKGIMGQVARNLSHTGVYGRPNAVPCEQVVSSLDLRS
ncbi:MAG: flagellar export chaperone FlgN [Phycisphaerales bacterium]